LEEVTRRGGTLTAEGVDLKVTPRAILDAGLRATITHHKSVLMRMLRSDGAVVVPEAAPDPDQSFPDHQHEDRGPENIYVHMPTARHFIIADSRDWIIDGVRYFKLNERFLEQLQITASRPLTTDEFRARVQQIKTWWVRHESNSA
ncbi:MAG: hypothetical protein HQK57_14710, partial [Deltaproteobacteria bacterium]|nr:hypothetical protein [Deltaproteobacteria bacterium]